MLNRLKARYWQYEVEAGKSVQKARPTDGLFGMGADPRKHPCHDAFYEDVGNWVDEFLNAEPSSQEADEAAMWIIKAAAGHRDTEVYWYMFAAQGYAVPLIQKMTPESCRELAEWYDKAYPKRDRMPVQQNVFKLLQKRAKGK